MNIITNSLRAALLAASVAVTLTAAAQNDSVKYSNIDKRVRVVTAYQPSVSDAFKINNLPQVGDTVDVTPTFDYSIVSAPIATVYTPEQIQAASMRGEPLDKLYKSHLTLGLGSNLATLADVKVNTLRSKDYQLGVQVHHYSSQAKVKLDNDRKVPAGYSTNFVRANGKKFVGTSTLFGDINLQRDAYKQYGYNTLIDSALDKKDIAQRYIMADAALGVESNTMDSSRLKYRFVANYGLTQEMEKYMENVVSGKAEVTKFMGDKAGGVELNGGYYGTSGNELDSAQYGFVGVTPWAGLRVDQMRIKAGITAGNVFGHDKFFIFPKIDFSYYLVDDIMVPYVLVDGDCKLNTYREISMENPFIYSGLQVQPTVTKIRFVGGIKGKLSKDMPFNISGAYSDIKDQYLFVNDPFRTNGMQNKFAVVYDDVKLLNVHAEVGMLYARKVNVLLKGDYWHYTLANEEYAWHKPDLEIGLRAQYNIQNKIIASTELIYTGGRKAINFADGGSAYNLKPTFDANLGVEYRYTKILSAFVQLNNIAAQQYNRWNFYPGQRFSVLVGATYAL